MALGTLHLSLLFRDWWCHLCTSTAAAHAQDTVQRLSSWWRQTKPLRKGLSGTRHNLAFCLLRLAQGTGLARSCLPFLCTPVPSQCSRGVEMGGRAGSPCLPRHMESMEDGLAPSRHLVFCPLQAGCVSTCSGPFSDLSAVRPAHSGTKDRPAGVLHSTRVPTGEHPEDSRGAWGCGRWGVAWAGEGTEGEQPLSSCSPTRAGRSIELGDLAWGRPGMRGVGSHMSILGHGGCGPAGLLFKARSHRPNPILNLQPPPRVNQLSSPKDGGWRTEAGTRQALCLLPQPKGPAPLPSLGPPQNHAPKVSVPGRQCEDVPKLRASHRSCPGQRDKCEVNPRHLTSQGGSLIVRTGGT